MLSENLCHPRHHKRGNRVSGGVERSETVLESRSLPAVRTGEGPVVYKVGEKTAVCTGEGLLVYRVGERQQFVQEKGFWCTEWGKDRSTYRRRACGVQSGGKTAVRTGEGLLVYRVGERQKFVQEKAFWCTNRVNSGAIAPQRDGGGRDEA